MKKAIKQKNNEGFSLIELIFIIAVLIFLAILAFPYFLKIINNVKLETTKNHMRESFTRCINDPNTSPTNPNIPGVVFQSSNCSNLISATIENSCTISMDLSNGAKIGWTNSYDSCISKTKLASSNSSSEQLIPLKNNSQKPFTNGHEIIAPGLLPNTDGMYKLSISPARLKPGEIAPIMATGGGLDVHLFVVGVDRDTYKLVALGDLNYISYGNPEWQTVVQSSPKQYGERLQLGLEHEDAGWSNRRGLALIFDDEIIEDYAYNTKEIGHDNPSAPGREKTHFGSLHSVLNPTSDPLKALNSLGINAPLSTIHSSKAGIKIFDQEIIELSKYEGEIHDVQYIDAMVHRADTRENGVLDFDHSTDEWISGHRKFLTDPEFSSKHPNSIKYSSENWSNDKP